MVTGIPGQENFSWSGPMVGLTTTYNFGNMKPKKSEQQRDNGGGEEMGFGED